MIKFNTEVPELNKGEIRIMFDDGKGMIVVDFEKGVLHSLLKEIAYEGLRITKVENEK